jgi:SAM-dependent methyltransferase
MDADKRTATDSDQEVERIRRVYRAYDADRALQARWSRENPGNRAIVDEVMAWFGSTLSATGDVSLAERRILEVGCGHGDLLMRMTGLSARPENLYGIDVLPERIEFCSQTYPSATFRCQNAASIDYGTGFFDYVLVSRVFSSILDDSVAARVAAEIQRVLRPGGAILWWDMRYPNPFNPHVRPMTRRRIQEYFGAMEIQLATATLVPAIARRLGRITPTAYRPLAKLPFLCSHWVGVFRKRV